MSDGLTEMYRDQVALDEARQEEWHTMMEAVSPGKVFVVKDMVNSPTHYTQHKWETIEVLEEYFGNDPLLWQVGKYLLRCNYKGNTVQDLEKAAWYLQRKINKLKENQNA